jgi:hypothetical protein
VTIADGETVHVVPLNDLRDHDSAATCWCHPTQDEEEPLVWVHHSMDGRENTIEKGNLQ